MDAALHHASQARHIFTKSLNDQLGRDYGENVHLVREVPVEVTSLAEFEMAFVELGPPARDVGEGVKIDTDTGIVNAKNIRFRIPFERSGSGLRLLGSWRDSRCSINTISISMSS